MLSVVRRIDLIYLPSARVLSVFSFSCCKRGERETKSQKGLHTDTHAKMIEVKTAAELSVMAIDRREEEDEEEEEGQIELDNAQFAAKCALGHTKAAATAESAVSSLLSSGAKFVDSSIGH